MKKTKPGRYKRDLQKTRKKRRRERRYSRRKDADRRRRAGTERSYNLANLKR